MQNLTTWGQTMAGVSEKISSKEVLVNINSETTLSGILNIPSAAKGVVLFAHGSGSSRHSPRNQFVARHLNEGHLATLLIDLLTPEEEAIDLQTRHLRFDVHMLAARLAATTDWLLQNEETKALQVGYFGSSTGAAAAIIAAADKGKQVKAVVSRGGRPDLAGGSLTHVKAPTLLIVGGDDTVVIDLNNQALALLTGTKQLEIIPGATHLFEERGTLEEVAKIARAWFTKYL